jgi:hypothetical protein
MEGAFFFDPSDSSNVVHVVVNVLCFLNNITQ